jgi:hypothetical protein
MLKFKLNGKIVGVLKDDASEPEGDVFKYKDETDIKTAEPKEELEEKEDAII